MVTPTSLRPALAAGADLRRWPRPLTRLAVLVAVLGVLAVASLLQVTAAAPAAARPAVEGEDTPLTVRMTSLSPSSIPRRGPVRVTGTVTNDDEVPWTWVRVYAFVGETPITTAAELDDATRVDPAQPVGERIVVPGSYDTLERIEPGQTLRFRIRVPRSALPSDSPGVYWFGVHALGSNGGPDEVVPTADGRARTFLPLVPAAATPTRTALVLPLRRSVVHAVDGALADVADWTRTLQERGRLGTLLAVAEAAGPRPVSWLVDPAVLDAVARLAAGNPPRSLAPTVEEPGGEDDADAGGDPDAPSDSSAPSPGESGVPGPEASETPADQAEDDPAKGEELDPETAAAADAARDWLQRFRDVAADDEVLALPYGDVDLVAAADHDPELYRAARARSDRAMAAWQLDAAPAAAPADGLLDLDALLLLERDLVVVVGDRMVPGRSDVVSIGGQAMAVASDGAAAGGPGPDDRGSALGLRQRVLAEAALRTGRLAGGLVVPYPADGRRRGLQALFSDLDAPFVDLSTVSEVAALPPRPLSNADLRYPEESESLAIGPESFAAVRALTRAGDSLQNILLRNDQVGGVVADQALSAVSYSARTDADAARYALDGSRHWIEERLGSIEIAASRGVTLSSSSGRFPATISNGLDQPVTVQVEALAEAPLEVEAPDPVTITAGGRTSVVLNAHAGRVGVHNVTLLVTDGEGTPLGSTDRLPVRSAQVSGVIWLIIAAGVGLLLGAVVVRLVRRVRAHRRSGTRADVGHDPEPEAAS